MDQSILRRSKDKAAPATAAAQPAQAPSAAWQRLPPLSPTKKPIKAQPAAPKPSAVSSSSCASPSKASKSGGGSASESFELVSPATGSSSSSTSASPPAPLEFETVKTAVATVLGEELQLDAETILMLSGSFQFDGEATLDEYGLDSLTAMKIAGRLSRHFDLLVPISPFMFFADPTMGGVVRLIIRLKSDCSMGLRSAAELTARNTEMSAVATAKAKAAGSSIKPPMSRPISAPAAATPASASASSSSAAGGAVSSPFILGLGCAVPGPGAPQAAIMEVMISDMELPPKQSALFAKIGDSAGIDRRYSVLPSIESIYFGRRGLGNDGQLADAAYRGRI